MDKDPQLALIGQKIRELREERGYSQEGFAAEAGFDRAYYGGVERGERNISAVNLIKIAEFLSVEIGEIFPKMYQLKKTK